MIDLVVDVSQRHKEGEAPDSAESQGRFSEEVIIELALEDGAGFAR